jgi:hypothetical protein
MTAKLRQSTGHLAQEKAMAFEVFDKRRLPIKDGHETAAGTRCVEGKGVERWL